LYYKVVVQEGCGLSTDVKGVNQSMKIQVEVTEAMDRERRKKNLIIRGIPETKEEEEYKDNVNNMISRVQSSNGVTRNYVKLS